MKLIHEQEESKESDGDAPTEEVTKAKEAIAAGKKAIAEAQ